jgi:hypothetical protein
MTTTAEDKTDGILQAGRELKHFDDTATRLVLEMQAHGWRGHMTSTGHAFMYAPDGTTTTSVSRESLRGRAGRNARAAFERWQRAQRQAREEAERTNAFGLTAEQVAKGDSFMPTVEGKPAPTALIAEIRRSEDYRAWVEKWPNAKIALANSTISLPEMDRPREWAAFDITVTPPVLIAHGSQCDVDQAWLELQKDKPELFGAIETDDNTDGGQAVKMYVCGTEDCKMQFESAGALNLHRSAKHPELLTCPVEGCGRQVRGHGGLGAHMRSHRPSKAVAESATTVAPPVDDAAGAMSGATVAPLPVGDVVMDHLERLPEGADAEQMIAAVRALIAAPLVNEVRRLREERESHLEQIGKLETDNANLEAKLTLMREALGL